MTEDLLSIWEREAKKYCEIKPIADGVEFGVPRANQKIISLISLIRTMRWGIEEINYRAREHDDDSLSSKWLEFETAQLLALSLEDK